VNHGIKLWSSGQALVRRRGAVAAAGARFVRDEEDAGRERERERVPQPWSSSQALARRGVVVAAAGGVHRR